MTLLKQSSSEEDLCVKIYVSGVVLPAWAAVLLCLCLLASSIVFMSVHVRMQNVNNVLSGIKREIRILQLHTQDIESVMIREGVASRKDFAEWSAK